MSKTLSAKSCVPCRGGVPPLAGEEITRLLAEVPGWQVVGGHHLLKAYTFPDFAQALSFVNGAGAIAMWAQLQSNRQAFSRALGAEYRKPQLRNAGLLYGQLVHPSDTKTHAAQLPAMRRAEYIVADELGAAAVAGSALLLALFCGLAAALRWIIAPADARPPRLFIGWRRAIRVIAAGAVLPLLVYLAYAWLTPLGGRGNGSIDGS